MKKIMKVKLTAKRKGMGTFYKELEVLLKERVDEIKKFRAAKEEQLPQARFWTLDGKAPAESFQVLYYGIDVGKKVGSVKIRYGNCLVKIPADLFGKIALQYVDDINQIMKNKSKKK